MACNAESSPGIGLLKCLTVVLEPAWGVFALWIPVCPMQHAAPRVPLVLAIEFDPVANPQRVESRRKVNVVRNEQRVAVVQGQQANEIRLSNAVVMTESDAVAVAGKRSTRPVGAIIT